MTTRLVFVAVGVFYSVLTDHFGQAVGSELPGCPRNITPSSVQSANVPPLQRFQTYLLLLLGFCGFSLLLALLYNAIRKHIFKDFQNLDSTFDAGGRVTLSLTATTVATQLLWPADLLQSATVATKNGLAGPFWYSVGVVVNVLLFPLLSVEVKTKAPGAKTYLQFCAKYAFWYSVGVVVNVLLFPLLSVEVKTKAPGAKTYLQIIQARFGSVPHITYTIFALVTNVVITSCLVLAARATIRSVTADASDEMVVIILAIMFGSYSFVGGLGTTFYVSYFNASLIFVMLIILILNIFYLDNDFGDALGTVHKMYAAINCTLGPEGNEGRSFLTFRSEGSLIFGVISIFLASSVTFCDQASWQSRIAAKPTQGVLGFLIAAFIWYAIPSTLATTTGMAYIAYSSEHGSYSLPDSEVNEGYVTPFITSRLLGETGAFMVLSMVSMALMSTGSGEVMAVSSILVYDIFQKYIRPFRRNLPPGCCVLCGKSNRGHHRQECQSVSDDGKEQRCTCVRVDQCEACKVDLADTRKYGKAYNCPTHGRYRHYQDMLIRYKDWCIVWVSMSIVPFGLLVFTTGIDLNWAFTAGCVITIGFCPAVFLCIIWVKTTGIAVTVGGIVGLLSGISVTLGLATTYEGGLSDFLANTGQDYSVLGGCCTSFGVSLILIVIISLCTHKIKRQEDADEEWMKTMAIRNPVQPWELTFIEDFPKVRDGYIPDHKDMGRRFRSAKILALVGSLSGIAVLMFILPGIMSSLYVMSEAQFTHWVRFCHVWTFIMAAFVIFAPPVQEIISISRQYRRLNRLSQETSSNEISYSDSYSRYDTTGL